jgi:hypothetical protein
MATKEPRIKTALAHPIAFPPLIMVGFDYPFQGCHYRHTWGQESLSILVQKSTSGQRD